MPETFLNAPFKDKDKVKALGGRWDVERRLWYVPAGTDLAPFAAWLLVKPTKALQSSAVAEIATDLALAAPAGEVAVVRRGMKLSELLAGVSQAVAQAFKVGMWTMVEVLDTRLRNGHVYIEVSERDADGVVLAKANAVIWSSAAQRILPEFERATGARIGPGIKLLVRARPVFKAQFGFSLEIDAIDPDYTLGDLEARKREIRARLQREGLFDANRKLPAPWDFNAVIVVAPQGAAGLDDFSAEAERLEKFGVCRFTYVYSRFQGEGAAAEIRSALMGAMAAWDANGRPLPDAVAIIRGGGAVNDLAWLNDYELARCICELEVPVLTGIGHERDSTVIDEVAHLRFDTPSKVALGIEQVIGRRAAEAKASFAEIAKAGTRLAQEARRAVEESDANIKSGVLRNIALARERSAVLESQVRLGALHAVKRGGGRSRELFFDVRQLAVALLADAKQKVPALLTEIRSESRQAVRNAATDAGTSFEAVTEWAALGTRLARESIDRSLQDVNTGARRSVAEAGAGAEGLMREITGQGPDKTLGRGFAIVRRADGRPVTGAAQVSQGDHIDIQFRDGRVAARTGGHKTGKD